MTKRPSTPALEAELCRRSFYFFIQCFWQEIISEPPVWNWHIKYLADELQRAGERVALKDRGLRSADGKVIKTRLAKEYDYIVINVPPGSSKSTVCSVMYPLWCWIIDPTQRFICGSYASTPAEDLADKSFKIFQSEKFVAYFPQFRISGGKTHFQNGLLGERYTTSTGSSITGIHAHQLLIDDPMNPTIAASKIERERANTWLGATLSSRKVDHEITTTIVIMQRLHEQDTTGYILSKAGLNVRHICIPAEVTKNISPPELINYYVDGLFDAVRRSHHRLQMNKIELGTYGYSGQMLQDPTPDEGGIIKKEWFKYIARTVRYADIANKVVHFQMDTAYTANEQNDPTAIAAYYIENNDIYIINVRSVWMEFPELIKWLPTFVKNNGYTEQSMIRVEPKASGKSIVQQIQQATKLNITEDKPPTADKLVRLHAVSPKIEAGRVILHEAPWNESFVGQVTGFPNTKHDDEVDILTALIRHQLVDDEPQDLGRILDMFVM